MNREELIEEGWIATSTSGGAHLKRTVEMYEELDFEVYLEEIDPEECQGCTECYKLGGEAMYRVYIKPKSEGRETG